MAKEILLDVSDLAPPEPLERSSDAVDALQQGEYIRMVHRQRPCLLYAILEERGYKEHTSTRKDRMVEVLIWRADDSQVEEEVLESIAKGEAA